MKIIVVGCGRVGSTFAKKMCDEGHDVTVIDKNPVALEKLGGHPGINMMVGTGIDTDVLETAGIKEADVVLAVSNGDNTNIMVAQIAQFLYKVNKVICRIVDPRVERFYKEEIGLTCYCHTTVSVEHYYDLIKGVC